VGKTTKEVYVNKRALKNLAGCSVRSGKERKKKMGGEETKSEGPDERNEELTHSTYFNQSQERKKKKGENPLRRLGTGRPRSVFRTSKRVVGKKTREGVLLFKVPSISSYPCMVAQSHPLAKEKGSVYEVSSRQVSHKIFRNEGEEATGKGTHHTRAMKNASRQGDNE